MIIDKAGCDKSKLSAKRSRAYELIAAEKKRVENFAGFHSGLFSDLCKTDEKVYKLLSDEYERVRDTIQLIAAENQCSRSVLAALGSIIQNKTIEGFAGKRYHGGSSVIDSLECIAIERAKRVFKAEYANVQPHSGTQANQIVMTAVLGRGDVVLSLGMDQGGHVSHGADVSFSGKFFNVENYCVDPKTFLLDYESVRHKAMMLKPKLIICGCSAYSRVIDFAKFRQIADECGAYLLADISHVSGLIAAGVHPGCIDHAHFTTTSTYKPGGPRGGLILMGRDFDTKFALGEKEIELSKLIDKATFPGVQGTPYANNIAAKAVFFGEMLAEEYTERQRKIIKNAQLLASEMADHGFDVITDGTDNHMVLINVANYREGLNGYIAQHALEDCGIVVNMNKLPYDTKPVSVTSGIRLGTPIITKNGMGAEQISLISDIIKEVLGNVEIVSVKSYKLDEQVRTSVIRRVRSLNSGFFNP